MKVLSFARKIAHEEGVRPASDAMLDYVIWEYTGYPSFWDGDPVRCFERQLREAFRKAKASPQAQ